jgi:hypothetical protein
MFFIYDALDQVVGNPNGYKRSIDAVRVINNRRTKAYKAVWAARFLLEAQQSSNKRIYLITAAKPGSWSQNI